MGCRHRASRASRLDGDQLCVEGKECGMDPDVGKIVAAQADFCMLRDNGQDLDEELEDGEAMSDDEILNEKGFSEL